MRVLSCVFLVVLSEAWESDRTSDDVKDLPSPLQKTVDEFSEQKVVYPVPFGHIPLEGVGDPISGMKQPLDLLELSLVAPKNSEEAKEMLLTDRRRLQIRNRFPKGFVIPRDAFLNDQVQPPLYSQNRTGLKWYDLVEMQRRNAMMPELIRKEAKKDKTVPDREIPSSRSKADSKSRHFTKNYFELLREEIEMPVNWTTCDEFGVRAIFSPKDIINIDWVPFYIWSVEGYRDAIVHKFAYPTKKLVTEYRYKYGKYLNKKVDWSKPKLIMNGMNEVLLIAADRKGLFDGIPKQEIPSAVLSENITTPSFSLRLKIEDPYLVMTYCEDYKAMVMAISGTEPTIFREMKAEAASIKFVGIGRPVWRNLEGERERMTDEIEWKLAQERDKFIEVGAPAP